MKEESIQWIRGKTLKWTSINNPGKKEVKYLRDHFAFYDVDLEDVVSKAQRSKVNRTPAYLFIVLLFPLFNRKSQSIEMTEVDFFVGKDYVITIHRGDLAPINQLFSLCKLNAKEKNLCFEGGSATLLYHILNRLWNYTFPMLDHISESINTIEHKIFSGVEKQLLKDILLVRQNIISFRTTMQPHQSTLIKIMESNHSDQLHIVQTGAERARFRDLEDRVKEIWETLSALKEDIEVLASTNQSLISYRTGEIMKMLAIISAVAFPMSVTASLFGTNAANIPFMGEQWDFWFIVLLLAIILTVMMGFFYKKKWF